MKLRDLWPMILTAPLLAIPVLAWRSSHDELRQLDLVDGHVIVVNKYKCSGGSGGSRRRPAGSSVCYELIVEYQAADGSIHRTLEYENTGFNAHVGARVPVYINRQQSGSTSDGATEDDYWAPTRGLAITMLAIFSMGSYASYLRVRRRRQCEHF